jgi:hypothetical protein
LRRLLARVPPPRQIPALLTSVFRPLPSIFSFSFQFSAFSLFVRGEEGESKEVTLATAFSEK